MKHEFSGTAPLVRGVFAIAALSATLSIEGFIDTAVRYAGLLETQHGQTMIAKTGAAKSIEKSAEMGGSNETQC